MNFLLEDAYPRVWLRFNGETSKRTYPATTLQEYVKPRHWVNNKPMVPQYKGRQSRSYEFQPKLLKLLQTEPLSMRALCKALQRTPSAVASGIKGLREKGHVIECRASEYYLIA